MKTLILIVMAIAVIHVLVKMLQLSLKRKKSNLSSIPFSYEYKAPKEDYSARIYKAEAEYLRQANELMAEHLEEKRRDADRERNLKEFYEQESYLKSKELKEKDSKQNLILRYGKPLAKIAASYFLGDISDILQTMGLVITALSVLHGFLGGSDSC